MVDGEPRTARGVAHRRKPEDTAQGCREMAAADRNRASDTSNAHKRGSFGRSADAWDSRADLLDRLEASAQARADAEAGDADQPSTERDSDGQGTGPIEQGETQAEGERRQGQERARPRIKGLSTDELPDRGD